MNRLRWSFACGALILLAGCGPNTWRNPQHPEYGQAEMDRNRYECLRENTHTSAYVDRYSGSAGPTVDYNMATACMKARGWYPVRE
jgi:hypothetical protein